MGRWLNVHPINEAGGLNVYRSVRNSPLNNADLRGLNDAAGAPANLDQQINQNLEAQSRSSMYWFPIDAGLVQQVVRGTSQTACDLSALVDN